MADTTLAKVAVGLRNILVEIEKDMKQHPKQKAQSVWDLKKGDKCWIISGKGSVMSYSCGFSHFNARRAKGDVFLTQEAAQKELALRKHLAQGLKQGLL